MNKPLGFPQCLNAVSATARGFLAETGGAVTSSFVVLSSAALTVTTATVLTVSTGAENKGLEIDEVLVQIDPSQALDLDSPPYNFPAENGETGASGDPSVIENDPFAPESSARSSQNAASTGGGTGGNSVGGSGSSSGGSSATGGTFGGGSGGASGAAGDSGEDTAGFTGRT